MIAFSLLPTTIETIQNISAKGNTLMQTLIVFFFFHYFLGSSKQSDFSMAKCDFFPKYYPTLIPVDFGTNIWRLLDCCEKKLREDSDTPICC